MIKALENLIRQSLQTLTHGRDKSVGCVQGWEADAHLGVSFHQPYQAISRLWAENILQLGVYLFLRWFGVRVSTWTDIVFYSMQSLNKRKKRFSTPNWSVDQRVCHAGRVPEVGNTHPAKVVPCVVLKITRRNSHQRPLVYVKAVSTRREFDHPPPTHTNSTGEELHSGER